MLVGDIALHPDRMPALIIDFGCHCPGCVGAQVSNCDTRTLNREHARADRADAGTSADNQGHSPGETSAALAR
jgi:hypothetical protein